MRRHRSWIIGTVNRHGCHNYWITGLRTGFELSNHGLYAKFFGKKVRLL